jgi:hypothetical protein
MAAHSRTVLRTPDPLDVPLRPLSIRTLAPRPGAAAVPDPVARVRSEFVEMRGFSPTLAQAARLFHMPADECERVLALLLREGFIRKTPDGRFRRVSD